MTYGDNFRFFAPLKFLVAQALSSGRIYAWYPWQLMGLPFVADMQAGWYYPLNVLFLAFDFELAYRIFVLIHYPLSAIFMNLLLRRIGVSEFSSLAGALMFSLSGYMIWQHCNPPLLLGYTWSPLAIYFMYRALKDSILWSLFAGAGLAMIIVVGEPQSAWVCAVMFIVMSAAYGRANGCVKRSFAAFSFSGTFAGLIGAAQILPTFELMRLSSRIGGFTFGEATAFSFHPGRLIEFIWPSPFGALLPNGLYWADFFLFQPISNTPFSFSDYLGLYMIALAGFGVVRGKGALRLWAGIGMAVFLVVVFGRYTPIYRVLFEYIVTFRIFRYPEKYMAWFVGFASLAAALGMDFAIDAAHEKKAKFKKWALAYIGFTIAAALAGFSIWPIIVTDIAGYSPGRPIYPEIIKHLHRTEIQFLIVNATMGFLALSLTMRKSGHKFAAALFIMVMAADHYITDVSKMPGGPSNVFDFKPSAAMAMESGGAAKLGRYRILNPGMIFKDMNPDLRRYSPDTALSIWRRDVLYTNLHVFNNFESANGYNPIQFLENQNVFRQARLKRLKLYNVQYAILNYADPRLPEFENTETVFADAAKDLTVIRLDGFLPRAYVVKDFRIARDDDEAESLLGVIDIEKSAALTSGALPQSAASGIPIKPANIVSYETDRVVLETDADFDGLLVLSDRYYPGWSASVDGKAAKIYKANVFVRGVPIGAGKHVVEFIYKPYPFRIGIFTSLVSVIFVFYAGIIIYRRKNEVP